MPNIPKEKIIDALKEGPNVPARLAKKFGTDSMIMGAMLSTLISTGDVLYSNLKVGGSPLYYLPGQEERLEEFLSFLNEKDQKTVRMLKEQKILQDSTQDPLIRVSLKAIKDFAKSLEIERGGVKTLFWRYYKVDKEEASALALGTLDAKPSPTEKFSTEIPQSVIAMAENKPPVIETEIDAAIETASSPRAKEPEKLIAAVAAEPVAIPQQAETPAHVKHTRHAHKDFLESIREKVHALGLDIINIEKIKRTEYNIVLKNHDINEYTYCVAKDKKTVNEGDLSTAFVFAHNKKMPCMFLMTGHFSKKAEHMLAKEFKDMKIEKV